jgi:outer membrane lipopolysaccharide assembly protein LptE/RlpB
MIFLSSCGFHLNGLSGDFKFPFETVYVECNNVIICQNFTNAIKTQSLAIIESTPDQAEVTIRLANEQTSRDPQGFNSVGRISSYLLTYQAQATVWQKSEQIGDDINLYSQIIMQYNDSTILADNQEEGTFWDQLHQNVTNQLIRRLVHFHYRNYSIDDSESK